MYKVLFITPSYKPAYIYGGPIYSTSGLAESLVKSDIDVEVYTTNANGAENFKILNDNYVDGVKVKYFKRQTKDHSHLSIGLLYHLWKNFNKYDSIHIHSWWNLVAVISLVILKLKRAKNIILSPRGMLSPYTINNSISKKLFHIIIGNYLLKGIKIHATSIDEYNKIQELNRNYKISIISNIIQLNTDNYQKDWSNEDLNILYLSRIHPKKNIEAIFYALSEFNFNFELNIIGDGDVKYINQLKKLANNLNIEQNVKWIGVKYNEEKSYYFKKSDIFILTSQDENFANSVLESLSYKTPVIISIQVGLSNFVQKYGLGWICNDAKCILKILNEVFRDKDILINKSENCLDAIQKEFDTKILTNKYIRLYQEL